MHNKSQSMSESHKERIPWNKGKHNIYSKETIQKMSDAKKGRCSNWKNGHPMLGRHHSEETRKKISKRIKGKNNPMYGKKHSEETKKKISEALKGKKHPNYGKHLSEEQKRQIGDANRGMKRRPFTEETKKKMSETHRGMKLSEETKKKISKAGKLRYENIFHVLKGVPRSEETKKKISITKIGEKNPMYGMSGILCPSWKGGLSFEPYGTEFNNQLRKLIRDRDNYVCQLCGTPENGRALNVHHIDYDKRNNSEFNLISLCPSCHTKTNSTREKWESVFCEYQSYKDLEAER